MNSVPVALISFAAFILAYIFYGKFLSQRIFCINPDRLTPAHEFKDGIDFVPTKRHILFGHHFTTIAGAAPIVGPAIAVIWGWLPALIWVILGSIFIGAVHDFGALVVSVRNKGKSIGEITKDLINPRVRTLFLLIIFFALLIVIAVFILVIGVLFKTYPAAVLPIWIEIPVAVALGFYFYKMSGNTFLGSGIALSLLCLFIYLGALFPIHISPIIMGNDILTWGVIMLVYAYIASILPVWVLLQPRDYINSHKLFLGMGLVLIGLFAIRPDMVAPAINPAPKGAPMMIPFLFITIACGAISGFHSLVSSGTTVKQLDNEKDMKAIGYGAMLGEGALAVMAILACTAGFPDISAWNSHYASWGAAKGLADKVGAFVEGCSFFLSGIGISHIFGTTIVTVIVISFAATTLDSATRIQRYVVAELAENFKLDFLKGPHPATMIAVISAFLLSMINGGKGGLILWPLFGAVNQLLAGLAFLAITIYLVKIKRPVYYTIIPMIFMFFMNSWAMLLNLSNYISQESWLLVFIGSVLLFLEIWIVAEGFNVMITSREKKYGQILNT